MDFTLDKLSDFRRALAYENRNYRLCCVLLATTLDREFILEFLCNYTELHCMTGDDILFVGPKLVPEPPPVDLESRIESDIAPERDLAWQSNLSEIRLHGLLHNTNTSNKELEGTFNLFLDFLYRQTAESYSFAATIGLSSTAFPALVFIDPTINLHSTAVWPLQGLSGESFTRQFRKLLEDLKIACGWGISRNLGRLSERLFDAKQIKLGIPESEIEARREISRLRCDLADTDALNNFYFTLSRVIALFDALRADASCRVPTENLAKSIDKLRIGIITPDSINHVRAHRTRWSSRLPSEYNQIAKRLAIPARKFIDQEHLIVTESEGKAQASRLEQELKVAEADLTKIRDQEKQNRNKEIGALSEEYARLRTELTRGRPPILTTIEALVNGRLVNVSEFNKHAQISERPLRIFISYSHDSAEHANRVLNLAQQLRGEGFDAWIDQFEVFPEEGFPRWMSTEIAKADYVLVICSKIYLRRFEGREGEGKGLGANFESFLITQELHDSSMMNRKFIPVLLGPSQDSDIPKLLRGSRRVCLPDEFPILLQIVRGRPTAVPISIRKSN
jgi:hypothetical protein